MIILFIATFYGLGASLTALDNLGQIGESLGYPSNTVSSFVSLVSIWNYFGRVFSGFASEIGFTYSAQFTLIFAIISKLFGLKYYSALFNCGYLYGREAKKQLQTSGKALIKGVELTCLGTECYRLSFVIMTSVTLAGAMVSVFLVMRTREFYKNDIYKV